MQEKAGFKELIKCFAEPLLEELPDMVEPYCAPVGTIIRIVKLAKKGTDNCKKILKGEEIPNYMDCVIYKCKEGYILSQKDQDTLEQIILRTFVSSDAKSLSTIAVFIDECMGGNIEPNNEDDYFIGDSYLGFNFCTDFGDEYEYDEEGIEYVMDAFNDLLGKNIFDSYAIGGHMDSWNE